MPDPSPLDTAPLRRMTIGRLIRTAREAAGRSQKDCARFIGVSAKRFAAYEEGAREPTFTEIEALAHYLNVPVHALIYEEEAKRLPQVQINNLQTLMQLRLRVVGARLKQARMERGESLKAAAQAMGLTSSQLNAYELGRRPISITLLERAMAHYDLRLDRLLDLGIGPIGESQLRLEQHARFDALPDEMRAFIVAPDAAPYLAFAMHLSKLPTADLRGLTKALRKITEDE
ncbi:MAG: helix-turn-helix transcriptional regulator [Anaerolineae bacterium]|nr:helix-turn-helix domain-containing protein [Candidatus Roseilinea sp.]MDW8450724.1 helix-turn-helix transcriptional regulator [Anaerolineae bacterium]